MSRLGHALDVSGARGVPLSVRPPWLRQSGRGSSRLRAPTRRGGPPVVRAVCRGYLGDMRLLRALLSRRPRRDDDLNSLSDERLLDCERDAWWAGDEDRRRLYEIERQRRSAASGQVTRKKSK